MRTKIYTTAEVQKLCDKSYQIGVDYTKQKAMIISLVASNLVLSDKFGWDKEQLAQFNLQVDKTFSAVNEKYVNVDELIEVCEGEFGMDLSEWKK